MSTNPNRASELSRGFLCSFLFIAAAIVAFAAIGSSPANNQGGSASPEDDGNGIAESANIRRQSQVFEQRVGDNAFHPKIAPWVLEHTANGQRAEFIVVLTDQADLSGAAALA